MTKLFDQAIEKVRHLPDDRQDEAADILMSLAAQTEPGAAQLTDAQAAEVRSRRATPKYASQEEVEAFFRQAGA